MVIESSRVAAVSLPTDVAIRDVLLDEIRHQHGRGGMKVFAATHGVPYDRVRDHLRGESDMTLKALLDYLGFLGLSLEDLNRRVEALG